VSAAPTFVALGFRPHTYWTAAVALAGMVEAPRVAGRRRIVFAAGKERGVYHRAAAAGLEAAPATIEAVRDAVTANATAAIAAVAADLAREGLEVRAAAAPAGMAVLPYALADILPVHSRQHAAEGAFYRDVVAQACEAVGLAVSRPVEGELGDLMADRLGLDRAALAGRLAAMGAAIGPPWSEDYRLACLAAWLALDDGGR
jgi:hypothetical protein